jgi:hypothetical protein
MSENTGKNPTPLYLSDVVISANNLKFTTDLDAATMEILLIGINCKRQIMNKDIPLDEGKAIAGKIRYDLPIVSLLPKSAQMNFGDKYNVSFYLDPANPDKIRVGQVAGEFEYVEIVEAQLVDPKLNLHLDGFLLRWNEIPGYDIELCISVGPQGASDHDFANLPNFPVPVVGCSYDLRDLPLAQMLNEHDYLATLTACKGEKVVEDIEKITPAVILAKEAAAKTLITTPTMAVLVRKDEGSVVIEGPEDASMLTVRIGKFVSGKEVEFIGPGLLWPVKSSLPLQDHTQIVPEENAAYRLLVFTARKKECVAETDVTETLKRIHTDRLLATAENAPTEEIKPITGKDITVNEETKKKGAQGGNPHAALREIAQETSVTTVKTEVSAEALKELQQQLHAGQPHKEGGSEKAEPVREERIEKAPHEIHPGLMAEYRKMNLSRDLRRTYVRWDREKISWNTFQGTKFSKVYLLYGDPKDRLSDLLPLQEVITTSQNSVPMSEIEESKVPQGNIILAVVNLVDNDNEVHGLSIKPITRALRPPQGPIAPRVEPVREQKPKVIQETPKTHRVEEKTEVTKVTTPTPAPTPTPTPPSQPASLSPEIVAILNAQKAQVEEAKRIAQEANDRYERFMKEQKRQNDERAERERKERDAAEAEKQRQKEIADAKEEGRKAAQAEREKNKEKDGNPPPPPKPDKAPEEKPAPSTKGSSLANFGKRVAGAAVITAVVVLILVIGVIIYRNLPQAKVVDNKPEPKSDNSDAKQLLALYENTLKQLAEKSEAKPQYGQPQYALTVHHTPMPTPEVAQQQPEAKGTVWFADPKLKVLWSDAIKEAARTNAHCDSFDLVVDIPPGRGETAYAFTYPDGWKIKPNGNANILQGAYNLGTVTQPNWAPPAVYPNMSSILLHNPSSTPEPMRFKVFRNTVL